MKILIQMLCEIPGIWVLTLVVPHTPAAITIMMAGLLVYDLGKRFAGGLTGEDGATK
jgi:hypothetical protein